jgi:hypothetical protein
MVEAAAQIVARDADYAPGFSGEHQNTARAALTAAFDTLGIQEATNE